MEHSFSDRLLLHPLFQGFSRLDFLDIVGATPFDFRSFSPKATLVHQGEPCVRLYLLLRGTVEILRESPNQLYSITEAPSAPRVSTDCTTFTPTQSKRWKRCNACSLTNLPSTNCKVSIPHSE